MKDPVSPHRPWGTTFQGTGDLRVAAGAIETAANTAGMTCRRQELADGILLIEAEQRDPWHQILLKGLPQRAVCRLRNDLGELSIYMDFCWFRWFKVILCALGLLFVLCLAGTIVLSRKSPGSSPVDSIETMLLLTSLFLIPVAYYLLAGGGHHTENIRQTLLVRVDNAGGFLEPLGSGVSRRVVVAGGTVMFSALILAVWVIWDTPQNYKNYIPGNLAVLLMALIILIFFLASALVLMLRRREFNFRVAPLQTGAMTATSVLTFLSPTLLWLGAGANIEVATLKAGEVYIQGEGFPKGWEGPQTHEIRQRMQRLYLPFRSLIRQFIAAGVLFLAIAVAVFARFAVYFSIPTARILWMYRESSGRPGVYQQTTRGGPFLRGFRIVFVSFWILAAGASLATLALLVLCAFQAIFPLLPYRELRLAELSAATVSFALGRPIGAGVIDVAVRSGWVMYAISGLALLAVSVGQLILEEHSEHRRLRSACRASPGSRRADLQKRVDAMASGLRIGPIRLVVSPAMAPGAESGVFGFWRQERFVEISGLCVDGLSDADVTALLAHEIAHHRQGHCRRLRLLRWLGRLSFVGDGFVLTLQNSWTAEESADELARAVLERLGVPPEVLGGALQRLRALSQVWKFDQHGHGGTPVQPENLKKIDRVLAEGLSAKPWRERWRWAWYLFRQQYFHALAFHYWHPPLSERAAHDDPS